MALFLSAIIRYLLSWWFPTFLLYLIGHSQPWLLELPNVSSNDFVIYWFASGKLGWIFFALCLCSAYGHESTDKTPVKLLFGRKSITPIQILAMISDSENKFVCQDVDKLVREAPVKIDKIQWEQSLPYNM